MSDPFKDALRTASAHSDTPETDADAYETDRGHLVVDADFACTLERQRNEALAEVARLQMELDASCNAEELRQVREENARLLEAVAVTRALAEWSARYPRGVIYSASNRQMDDELIKLEGIAKNAIAKLSPTLRKELE